MSLTKFAQFDVLEAFSVPAGANALQRIAARTVAHRHQFDYEPRPGFIYVRSRAISSRCNDNFDLFPADEIKKAYRTFIGKPVFVNHKNADHRRARGYIMDAALHEDTNPDGSPDTWIEVLMEVDAVRFPRLAEAVLRGDIARTSMGTDVAYSICTACGNKAVTPADYCQHIPALKGLKIQKRLASGATEEVLIAEECHGLGFFENSLLVEPPADPTAYSWVDHDASGLSVAASRKVAFGGVAEPLTPQQQVCPHNEWTLVEWARGYVPPSGIEIYKCDQCAAHRYYFPDGDWSPVVGTDSNPAWVLGKDPMGYYEKNKGYFEKVSSRTAERKAITIKARDIAEGDRLDAAGKTRVDKRHPRTDKVLVRTKTTGTRSPSVSQWDPEEDIKVWREAALHVHAGKACDYPGCDYAPTPQPPRPPWGSEAKCSTCGHALLMTGSGWKHCGSHEEQMDSIWVPGHEGRYSVFEQRDDDHPPTPAEGTIKAMSAVTALLRSEALAYEPAGEGYCTAKGRGASRGSQCSCNEFVASQGPNTNMDGWEDCARPGCGHSKQSHVGGAEIVSEGSKTAADDLLRCRYCDGALKGDYDNVECTKCGTSYDPKSTVLDDHPGKRLWVDGYGLAHIAYGEVKAPAQVDTMRAESCPVCGDDEGFSGEKCNVCGYTQPPSQFRDPDLEKAKQQDLRQDKAEQQGHDMEQGVSTDGPVDVTAPQAPGAEQQGSEDLQCTNCGEVFSAEGQPEGEASTRDVLEEDPSQEAAPEHPDASQDPNRQKVGPDGQPVADDKAKPEDERKPNPFKKKDEQEQGAQKPEVPAHGADPNIDPKQQDPNVDPRKQPAEGEGRVTPQDQSAVDKLRQHTPAANTTCPVCGKGTLIPVAQPDPQQVDDPTSVDVPTKNTQASTASRRGVQKEASTDMNQPNPNPAQQRRSLMVQAIAEQQDLIDGLKQENAGLRSDIGYLTRATASLAIAAKVDRHPAFAPIVRAAGLQRKADGAQNPDGAPATTTEQAKQPQATDDVTSPGAVPAPANADVTPKAVTDVNTPNVAADAGADTLKNLTDVTAPTAGTDAVYPEAATGEGKVEVGSGDNKSFDSTGPAWSKSSAVERFTASLRLARLQISAGIAPEGTEDIALSEKIAESSLSTEAMLAQIDTLKSVQAARTAQAATPAEQQRRRALVPQPEGRQGGIRPMAAQVEAPQFAGGLPTIAARAGEDEWMVGDAGTDPLG